MVQLFGKSILLYLRDDELTMDRAAMFVDFIFVMFVSY